MKTASKIITFLSILLLAGSCADRYEVLSGYAQGGTYTVKYNSRGVRLPAAAVQHAVDSILTRIDSTLSGYNRLSLLSRLNSGGTVPADPMFLDIYRISHEWWEATGGALDVSCGPVFNIWGFGFTGESLPSDERIDSALAASGMGRLRKTPEAGRNICAQDLLLPGQEGPAPVLNFNAIAQGYSCDLVADYLHGLGVRDMLVDIGEIWCEGLNPGGKGWTIGIDTPDDGNETPGASISGVWHSDGSGKGVVTSGNYRKFYIMDGRKYAHTLDPRTGRPVTHNLLSATVIAPSATAADALATYFMVIGPQEARLWVESHADVEACLISADGIWMSEGFSAN